MQKVKYMVEVRIMIMICKICGISFDEERYSKPYDNICSSKCFDKQFWLEKIKNINDLTIVDGKCYYIDNENSTSSFRGYNSRHFLIKYIDGINKGKVVSTTNLWYNGEIPKEFRDKLKNNAIFCKSRIEEYADKILRI